MKYILRTVGSLILTLPLALSAQTGDTRAQGMAGAMTALGDDMNTLFYNPAGLAYLRKGFFDTELNASASFNKGLLGIPSLPDVQERTGFAYADNAKHYAYWDNFLGAWIPVDFAVYRTELTALMTELGRDAASFDSLSPGDKYLLYRQYYASYSAYDNLSNFGPLDLRPRVLLGGRFWGLALLGDYHVALLPTGYAGLDTPIEVSVQRTLGAVAGLGLPLGPVAVGANLRYFTTSHYDAFLGLKELSNPGGPSLVSVLGPSQTNFGADSSLQVGLGVVFTLGILNAAAYNANVLPFLDKAYNGELATALLSTTTVGFSVMPSDDKFSDTTNPFWLAADLDLSRVGDVNLRQLAAGVEAGIKASGLEALLRLGYQQPLPGEYRTMISTFDPLLGAVTAGFSTKLLVVRASVSATLPLLLAYELGTYGSMTAAQRAQSQGSVSASVALDL
ncbi:MAG: hypothetical protein WCG80_09235 [Spirochaetales bacterium]